MTTPPKLRDVIIIGGGPAGLTAALYNARAGLAPLVFEGYELPGGQLMTTTEVENFPGFPEGVDGKELMERFRKQAQRFGAEVIRDRVTKVDLAKRPFEVWIEDERHLGRTIIIATGASPRKLGIPSETKYWGVGHPGSVTSCATCDGAFYKGQVVAVLGGGDSAMEEATFLTRFCEKVYVVHRRAELRASKVMQQRARENAKIEFLLNYGVEEVLGNGKKLTGLRLKGTVDGNVRDVALGGIFLAIGHIPQTDLFKGQLAMNAEGYLDVKASHTSVPGVFACGDVHDTRYRQAITAAGMGCAAALEAQHFLAEEAGTAQHSQLYAL